MRIRELINELVRQQRIACSSDCDAKYGIERVSVDETISALKSELFKALPEEKEKDFTNDYYNGLWRGYNQAIAQTKARVEELFK